MSIKQEWIYFIRQLQDRICESIELCDGVAVFEQDEWNREGGGGGVTRIIRNGNVFEKGGVNISTVFGGVTEIMRSQLKVEGGNWFACGLSLVLHPFNPMIPTVHCNYRMFELYNDEGFIIDRWFGGGCDLTPFYLFEEDAMHFHRVYKNTCDHFDPLFYNEFKKNCDDYFVNWHRNKERRGIGGIFYDYQRPDEKYNVDFWMDFTKSCANAFIHSYIPIADKRKYLSFTNENKYWQEIRRGRYTEFNLIHDRGTLFGLKSNGRTESILMSLPPTLRFEYQYAPDKGSEEDKLLQICLKPINWL